MSRSLARTAVLAALAAVLAVLGVAPALAVTTAPVPGTPECTAAVNNDATVQAAVAALNTARTTLLTDQINGAPAAIVAADQTAVDNAVNHVAVVRNAASDALCTGTAVVTTATPVTTTPESTSPPVIVVPRVVILPGVLDRNCADFATQADAQAFFLAHGGSPVRNVDNLDANHNGVACEDHFAPAVVVVPQATTVVTTKTVVATQDDGTVPITSGQQVTEVPTGSASTGSA